MNSYTQIARLVNFSKNNPAESRILEEGASKIVNGNVFLLEDNNSIIDAHQNSVAIVEAKSITFSSEESLNFFYSLHLAKQYLVAHLSETTTLIKELNNLYSEHLISNKHALKLTFVILQNYFGVDVLRLLGQSSRENFWLFYRYVRKIIPLMEIDVDTVGLLLKTLLKQTENDMTQGELFTAMSELAENQPDRGQQIINHLIASNEESPKTFINSMLKGLSKTLGVEAVFPQVKKLIEDDLIEHQKQGLFAASLFYYLDSENGRNQLAYLGKVLEEKTSGKSDELLPLIVRVYDNLLTQLPQAKAKILLLSEVDNPDVKYNVALAIWQGGNSKDSEWQREVLLKLASTRAEYKGATRIIDNVLTDMVDESPSAVVDFANEWMRHEYHKPNDILDFANTLIKLHNTDPSVFQALITSWFNQDDIKYPATIAAVLRDFSSLSMKDLILHQESLSKLSFQDVKFIVYKILGFVYAKEHLRSLVFSAIKGKPNDPQTEKLVVYAFTSYIAYNYPSTDEDFLREKAKQGNEQEKRVAKTIIKQIDSYFQQRKELPVLSELASSENRENLRQKAYAKTFVKSYAQHEKDHPSLSSMLTTIQLKSGNKWFAKIDGQYSEESRLGKVQSSVELPIGLLTDPVGQDKLRHLWQAYTRS